MKRNKYGNKKFVSEGVKFDSKLEFFMYQMLKSHNLDFEFQVEIELIPVHRLNGSSIRKSSVIVDFVIKYDDIVLYVDTKGFATDVSKLKYKLLGYNKMKMGANFRIIWLKTNKEVIEFINKISNKDERKNERW